MSTLLEIGSSLLENGNVLTRNAASTTYLTVAYSMSSGWSVSNAVLLQCRRLV